LKDGRHNSKELQLALAHESDTMSKEYVHLAQKITLIVFLIPASVEVNI